MVCLVGTHNLFVTCVSVIQMGKLRLLPLTQFLDVNDTTTVADLKQVIHLTQKYPLDEVCILRPNGERLEDAATWAGVGSPSILLCERLCTVKVGDKEAKMLPGSTVAEVKVKLGLDGDAVLRFPDASRLVFVARAAAMRQTLATVVCSVDRTNGAVTKMQKTVADMYKGIDGFADTKVGDTKKLLKDWAAAHK